MKKQLPRYPQLHRSLLPLKGQWRRLAEIEQWRLLRRIASMERLHVIRHYDKRGRKRVANAAPQLRRRRIEIASTFLGRGYDVSPCLLRHALPNEPSGRWLEPLIPWAGPNMHSNNAMERDVSSGALRAPGNAPHRGR
jgi:hypothetical protein